LRAYQLRRFQLFQFHARSVTIRVNASYSALRYPKWIVSKRIMPLLIHIGYINYRSSGYD